MNKIITVFFTNSGTPATLLTPTIRIRDISNNALVVTDGAMTEVGDGWYKYTFATYNLTKEYVIRCDGGSGLSAVDRYMFGSNDTDVHVNRKILMNKLSLKDGTHANWILYDDDGATSLLTFDVSDQNSGPIKQPGGAPSKRSRGTPS